MNKPVLKVGETQQGTALHFDSNLAHPSFNMKGNVFKDPPPH